MSGSSALADRFISDALANRHNSAILASLGALDLPDAWLVAGCLFQSVWNQQAGRAPETAIKDYDIFYFDPSDLSATAERAVQARVQSRFESLGVIVEACNQARVHLWYEAHFGETYSPLRSSREGIDRFLVCCTCVGIQASAKGHELYAPFGVEDIYRGVLQHNDASGSRALFDAKVKSYRERWPQLHL